MYVITDSCAFTTRGNWFRYVHCMRPLKEDLSCHTRKYSTWFIRGFPFDPSPTAFVYTVRCSSSTDIVVYTVFHSKYTHTVFFSSACKTTTLRSSVKSSVLDLLDRVALPSLKDVRLASFGATVCSSTISISSLLDDFCCSVWLIGGVFDLLSPVLGVISLFMLPSLP